MAISLHLVTRLSPARALFERACAADVSAGRAVVVLLLHDAVAAVDALRPAGVDARVVMAAEDCRRRGLSPAEGALEYPEIVELLASAERVASW